MKKRLFYFLSLALILSLTTCKKDDDTPSPDEIIISKETKVINDQTWSDNLISLDTSNYTLTFSDNINSSQSFVPGNIILSGMGEGLMRKVKTVSEGKGQIRVETEVAYLSEVIQQGLIEIDQPLTVSMIKSIDYHYVGIKLKNDLTKSPDQTLLEWDINTVLFDADQNASTTYDQIKLLGGFSCDWHLIAKIDIGFFQGLKEVKFAFESNENLDLQLFAGMGYSFEKSFTIATVNFSPIVVTIGVIPIVFTPQLKVNIGVDGYANANITTGIEQNLTFNAGIHYLKNQGWSPFNTFSKSLTFQPPQLNMNAGAEAYLKPELSIKLFGIAGPFANLRIYGKLEADLMENPWWKVYGGLNMNAGVKIQILDRFLLDYTINDLIKYEISLGQSTSPPLQIPEISTLGISNILQTSASGGGNITNDGNATITARGVCWSTNQNPTIDDNHTSDGTGTGSFSSTITGLTENTTYHVRAYATNSEGTGYGNQVTFISIQTGSVPIVTTDNAMGITGTSASLGGNVVSDGGQTVSERGIYWGVTSNPVNTGNKLQIGAGTGHFSTALTNLSVNTTYYIVAYASNVIGMAYGNQIVFTTSSGGLTGTVTDVDGNIYNTVIIGTQEWMAENLKTIHFSDGSVINLVTNSGLWANLTSGGYCYYNNSVDNGATYGALYNWQTVNDSRNLCPMSWHVPSDSEWTILANFLGGESVAGGKLKSVTGWNSPNTGATNESGFTALPGGYRYNNGTFDFVGNNGAWWSSTQKNAASAYYRNLHSNYSSLIRHFSAFNFGFSIRCVKN